MLSTLEVKNHFLKPIFKNIPEDLKCLDQWVCWKAEVRDGKVEKVPYTPITGSKAKSNDPGTFADFDRANKSYVDGNIYDGIGFVLTKDDPFVAWDLDNCRNPETGEITNRAASIIKRLDSYTEISPSGTGIRIFVKAKLPDGRRKKKNTEVYESVRYMTLTGNLYNERFKKVEECQIPNDKLYSLLFKPRKKSENEKDSIAKNDTPNNIKKILQKAFTSENGKKIKRLYNGDSSDYPSQSEADQALCNYLTFWFNRNPLLVDSVFRLSGLFRDKWDEKHFSDGRTYGEATIQNAIEDVSDTYRSKSKSNSFSDSGESKPLTFISINELLSTKFDPEKSIISGNILPEGGGLIMAGESEVGKSLITLEWAIHLALGRHLLGGELTVTKPRKIIIFQTENIPRMVQERLKIMLRGLNITAIPDNIFFSDARFSYDVMKKNCVEQMIASIEKCGAEIFMVDPLISFHRVNENDNSAMRGVMEKFTYISRSTGAASIIAHHFGKPGETRDIVYRLRGATSIRDWVDTLITLEHKKHEHKTLRLLKFGKMRYGKKPNPIFLERDDDTLLHNITESDIKISPTQISALIENQFNGRVEKQSYLLEALAEKFNCSERTAQRALKEAVKFQFVQEKKKGTKKEYRVSTT